MILSLLIAKINEEHDDHWREMVKKGRVYLGFGLLMIVAIVAYVKLDKYRPTPKENLVIKSDKKKSVDWTKVKIDKVRVYKAKRRLELLQEGVVIQSYPMRLGFEPIGHKTTEGDGKTPEGTYRLDWRNNQSAFYRSIHVDYPNKIDTAQAKERGVSAGGEIMIHGSAKRAVGSKGQTFYDYLPKGDWTNGCIAVSNIDMDEIWDNVKNGTVIEIYP